MNTFAMRAWKPWIGAGLAALATSASAGTGRLTLNPYDVIGQDFVLQANGTAGPIVMPEDGSPTVGFAFTVPSDYGSQALRVVLLWESPNAHDCTFHLLPNSNFRARNGGIRDFGGASQGLVALEASTPFSLAEQRLTMAAPDPSGSVESAIFLIRTSYEFPGPFRPGDAVNFSIYRLPGHELDTCTEPLVIDGVSIEYETATPP